MTFREVLQIEVWSKRVTRDLLIGFGVLVTLISFLYLFDMYWTSPGERKAGREALASIDALQNEGGQQFDLVDSQAKEKVDVAQKASLTSRDQRIAIGSSVYLWGIEFEQKEQMLRSASDERIRKLVIPSNPQTGQLENQTHDGLGKNLHRVLD